MEQKNKQDRIKTLRSFWHTAHPYIVSSISLLLLYHLAMILAFSPKFATLQASVAKQMNWEVDAIAVSVFDEEIGTVESRQDVQDAWIKALDRVTEETGNRYKVEAQYTIAETRKRPSEMISASSLEDVFYEYISDELAGYSVLAYAVSINDAHFVLRTENDVLDFFTLIAQSIVDTSKYSIRCVDFDGEPIYEITPVRNGQAAGAAYRFSSAIIKNAQNQGSVPTESDIGNSFAGVFIEGNKTYQAVYVRENDINTAEEAYELCSRTARREAEYEILRGDTVKSVLKKFDMTIEEFQQLNPSYNSSSALYVGRMLRVLTNESLLSVYRVERSISHITVEPEIEYSYNSDKNVSYTQVLQAGKAGSSLVDEFVFYDGNTEVDSVQIGEFVLEQPVIRRVMVGSKSAPQFVWPVYGSIGWRFNAKTEHYGLDIRADVGTYIYAAASGVVTLAEYRSNTGNTVYINHQNDYRTFYYHMKSLLVSAGDYVEQGQIIGTMGNTGTDATGTHLHFAVYQNSTHTYLDPERFLKKR